MENDTILKLQKQILNLEKRLEQYYHLLLSKIGATPASISVAGNKVEDIQVKEVENISTVNEIETKSEEIKICDDEVATNILDENNFIDGQLTIFPNTDDEADREQTITVDAPFAADNKQTFPIVEQSNPY